VDDTLDTASADVLVIDDDPIMRDLVSDWLEAAGYRVRRAANCAAGLAEMKLAVPALVVTDMCMPGASGALAIAKLKRERPGTRVIAISGHFNSGQGLSAEAALRAGAARALAKPVKRSDVVSAVAELIGRPAS
jgi:DNA-binding NtrC family response regulator